MPTNRFAIWLRQLEVVETHYKGSRRVGCANNVSDPGLCPNTIRLGMNVVELRRKSSGRCVARFCSMDCEKQYVDAKLEQHRTL